MLKKSYSANFEAGQRWRGSIVARAWAWTSPVKVHRWMEEAVTAKYGPGVYLYDVRRV